MKPILPLHPLRTPSARPGLVVSERQARIVDPRLPPLPASPTPVLHQNTVGTPGPWSLGRVVPCLPLKDGPVLIQRPTVVHDHDLAYIADIDGNLIGAPGIRVNRLLSATKVVNTRRL